jgi:transposase
MNTTKMKPRKRPGGKCERPLVADDGWRIPDALGERMGPLLPPGKPHPLGCHHPRVDHRKAMDAVFFVARTGCQWNAWRATGICSSSAAHRRFQEWTQAGVFLELWARGLMEFDKRKGIDWSWQSMDGAMTKAPLGGEKNRAQPHRSRQAGRQAERVVRGARRAHRPGRRCGPSQ